MLKGRVQRLDVLSAAKRKRGGHGRTGDQNLRDGLRCTWRPVNEAGYVAT